MEDDKFNIVVRWYPQEKKFEALLEQSIKENDNVWRVTTVYQAYPEKIEKSFKSDDPLLTFLDDPNEIRWNVPRAKKSDIEFLKQKTRELAIKSLFEYKKRLFK